MDIIHTQLGTAHVNIVKTNKELVSAQQYQRSSTRKYLYFLVCVLVTTGVIVGFVYLFK